MNRGRLCERSKNEWPDRWDSGASTCNDGRIVAKFSHLVPARLKPVDTSEPGSIQAPARRVVQPVLRLLWKADVEGLEHIPREGPALIAPNHISFFDSVFMLTLMTRRILAVGKAEYMDSWASRHLFPAAGMIPIDRSGGSAGEAALNQAAESLDRGDLFLIFPEGTRSRDGNLHRGRTGVARLALRTGAPIIPVGIKGTDAIQPPGARFPRPFKPCSIHFGRPINAERYQTSYEGDRPSRAVLREMTDEVMYEIGQLSGQNYVDTYGNAPTKAAQPESLPEGAPALA